MFENRSRWNPKITQTIQVVTATLYSSQALAPTRAMQAFATLPPSPAFVLPEPVAAFARFFRVQTIAIRTGYALREHSRRWHRQFATVALGTLVSTKQQRG